MIVVSFFDLALRVERGDFCIMQKRRVNSGDAVRSFVVLHNVDHVKARIEKRGRVLVQRAEVDNAFAVIVRRTIRTGHNGMRAVFVFREWSGHTVGGKEARREGSRREDVRDSNAYAPGSENAETFLAQCYQAAQYDHESEEQGG